MVAFVADIGQERSDLEGVEQKPCSPVPLNVTWSICVKRFIRDYVYPVLQTGAPVRGNYLPGYLDGAADHRQGARSSWR